MILPSYLLAWQAPWLQRPLLTVLELLTHPEAADEARSERLGWSVSAWREELARLQRWGVVDNEQQVTPSLSTDAQRRLLTCGTDFAYLVLDDSTNPKVSAVGTKTYDKKAVTTRRVRGSGGEGTDYQLALNESLDNSSPVDSALSPGSAAPLSQDQILAVHQHANQVLGYTRRLTKKRAGIIRARLREGFTVEDLQAVATWVSGNAFLRGSNSRNRAYDDYSTIYRSGDRVDEYLKEARKPSLDVSEERPTFLEL